MSGHSKVRPNSSNFRLSELHLQTEIDAKDDQKYDERLINSDWRLHRERLICENGA